MSDNFEINDRYSAPRTMGTDQVGGVDYQIIKLGIGADGQIVLLSGNAGAADAGTIRVVEASDSPTAALSAGGGTTSTASFDRPANTTAYSAGASWANAVSGAAVRTLDNASRGAGKSGVITDIMITLPNSPALQLTGELWIFDSAPTPLQDGAAWALSDADLLKVVAVVPFSMQTTGSSSGNAYDWLEGQNIGFTTVADAKLYVIPKVTNAYVPAASEVLTVRAKILRSN